jgi:hypothetical protein
MKRIFFFSTTLDIRPVLQRIERYAPLQFAEAKVLTTPNRKIYFRAIDIPGLGFSTHETGSLSASYMVSLKDALNHMHAYETKTGEKRWTLRNCDTEGTVMLTPAGLWKEMLLPGNVSTLHSDPVSQKLMRLFNSALRAEGFVKAGIWWLGKEAVEMFKAGRRLSTTAEQSPPEFDLRFELLEALAQKENTH